MNYFEIANVKQHVQFENYLHDIITDKNKREQFYDKVINQIEDIGVDSFKDYFEQYSAERKTNMQDYTPDSVSYLVSIITRTDGITDNYAGVDWTAGTGSMIIKKWWDDMVQEDEYNADSYVYLTQEYADNAIPYLIHNLAMRGINAVVIHGDTLNRETKCIYFLQRNEKYSDINIMPRTPEVEETFKVKFIDKQKEYIESLYKQYKQIEVNSKKKQLPVHITKPKTYGSKKDELTLSKIATVERAQASKIYPKGTIVIQISATRGQIGMLKSDGNVEPKYACIMSNDNDVLFHAIKKEAPRYFAKVQEDLNLTLEDIKNIQIPTITNGDREFAKVIDKIQEFELEENKIIESYKLYKKKMLNDMFPK